MSQSPSVIAAQQQLLQASALRIAQEHLHLATGFSRIYHVSTGWVTEYLSQDPSVMVCKNPDTLEKAITREADGIIFIPSSAHLSAELVASLANQASYKQIILLEVTTAANAG